VIANQEENTRGALEELAARVPVLVSLPRRVEQGVAHLARLARILGVEQTDKARDLIKRGYALGSAGETARRAFVPIWMDPLMTVNGQTFMSDALRLGGGSNVFADRQRMYPLSADLGQAIPRPAGTRDTRYPRVTLEEVRQRAPAIVLLPDEPHPFSEQDAAVFRAALAAAQVVRCGGRDFSWYGAQSVEGIPRLRALIDGLR
jgi:ABC-type Fe3+-hydroxamate transport system substrate-binding protein